MTAPSAPSARAALSYLTAPEFAEYVSIMDVLESSVTDLTPAEISTEIAAGGTLMPTSLVIKRLDSLHGWGAASPRTDSSNIRRYADLLARNYRWTASPAGRLVHRFFQTELRQTPLVREIPLASLQRVVDTLRGLTELVGAAAACLDETDGDRRFAPGVPAGEVVPPADDEQLARALRAASETSDARVAEHVGRLFTSHDDLDGALVGAEDGLTGLVDRYDLDDTSTGELKELLVDYATRVAVELERGADLARRELHRLRPWFAALAQSAVNASQARALIERGALVASRGGRTDDWGGLCAWFAPDTGRAARFSLRLIRAIPGMHANIRRLHTSSGTATNRARALDLAVACTDPQFGTAVFLAAVGDHSWRKLACAADDDELGRTPPWRDGPAIEVPDLLTKTGRTGARGAVPAARDDSAARAHIIAARGRRRRAYCEAVAELLAAVPGQRLSAEAARAGLSVLILAAAAAPQADRRSAAKDGLACTLVRVETAAPALRGPTWYIRTPGRLALFHRAGSVALVPRAFVARSDDQLRAELTFVEGAA